MAGFIDIVCNLYTPEAVASGWTGLDDDIKRQVRMPAAMFSGVAIDDYLRKMDRPGIERSLLIAVRAGDLNVRGSWEIPSRVIADICRPPRLLLRSRRDQPDTRDAGNARPDAGGRGVRLRRRVDRRTSADTSARHVALVTARVLAGDAMIGRGIATVVGVAAVLSTVILTATRRPYRRALADLAGRENG